MKKGLLLINLGSPDSTNVQDVKEYLREFLSDPLVIDYPYLVRKFVVEGIILPRRPKHSAEAYKKIWWKEGSPLIVLTERLKAKIEKKLEIPVSIGMRYKNPSIQKGIQDLYDKGVREILVLPLYPQYTMSTTETVVKKTNEVQKKYFKDVKLTYLNAFYNHPDYIKVLADSIKKNLPEELDKILLSYHGIPERHDEKARIISKKKPELKIETYRNQCLKTTELVREEMKLDEDKIQTSFQSRLGKDPWIQPFTDETLENFPKQGIKKIAVVAPAFVSDCLETLEEIAMEGKEEFLEHGGEEFTYIDCLNDSEDWVNVIVKWTKAWAEK